MNQPGNLFKVFSSVSNQIWRRFDSYDATSKVAGLGKKALIKLEKSEEIKMDVEKDAKILVSEVCGTNLLAEGGENVKIKPDSEYPDWLWEIHIGDPLPLEKLDPNSLQYWNRVRRWGKRQDMLLKSLRRNATVHK